MSAASQFLRVEAFPFTRAADILNEANRKHEHCTHVSAPQEPSWMAGNAEAVMASVAAFTATPAEYVKTNGQRAMRKRRCDSRCLVAGVCSWPVEMAHLRQLARNDSAAYEREKQRMFDWMKRTQQCPDPELSQLLEGISRDAPKLVRDRMRF